MHRNFYMVMILPTQFIGIKETALFTYQDVRENVYPM